MDSSLNQPKPKNESLQEDLARAEEEIKEIENLGICPFSPEEISSAIETLSKPRAKIKLDDPCILWIKRQKQKNIPDEEIKKQADEFKKGLEKKAKIVKITRDIMTGQTVDEQDEITMLVRSRIEKGETSREILEKSEENLNSVIDLMNKLKESLLKKQDIELEIATSSS